MVKSEKFLIEQLQQQQQRQQQFGTVSNGVKMMQFSQPEAAVLVAVVLK